MSEIIHFEDRRRKRKQDNTPPAVIIKSIDGKLVEYVNCDVAEMFFSKARDLDSD